MSEEDIIKWREKPAMVKVDFTLPVDRQLLFLCIPPDVLDNVAVL